MDSEERQIWLNNLKAGDQVAYRGSYGSQWFIATVEKRTKTQRIVTEHHTFNSDGVCNSRGYGSPSNCEPVTEEIKNKIWHRVLSEKLRRYNWEKLSLDVLRKVMACLPSKDVST